ncbi:MAG: MFS transporter [Thermodesulfobacteriota bacterium]|nr:MFS transporter [Thermodesulfobacteriota bacterium]
MIALVHFIHDTYTGLLAPILPLLIEKLGLSLTQAGSLTVFVRLPSLFNPFLGSFADQKGIRNTLVIISPGLTATFMSLTGMASGYGCLIILLLAAGISVAALHVSAPVITAELSGNAVGKGMSLFMVGGEMARTLAPLMAVWATSVFGLEGIWHLMFVGWTASAILWWRLGRKRNKGQKKNAASLRVMIRQMRMVMTGVFGVLVARAFLASSITTYLVTFIYDQGHSLWFAGACLSVFEATGVAGVLVSGTLSDHIGRKKVIACCTLVSPVMLIAMLHTQGAALFIVLGLLGFFTLATGPVLMAVILENAGANQMAANGMFMAISFAVRASTILLIGKGADILGMHTAYLLCAIIAFFGLPFIPLLPKPEDTA